MKTGSTNPLRGRIALFFATFFYIGYIPLRPGTVVTVGAVGVFYVVSGFSLLSYFLFLLGFIIFSVWVSSEAEEFLGKADPAQIVIDEVCGYLVTMLYVAPNLTNIITGFILFRFFDIAKPPPLRKLERLPGGVGIVADDILAGIYSNIVLQIITGLVLFSHE